ncbi:hypothetical protein PHAVU_002G212166 [Phaseolus vulgaris]
MDILWFVIAISFSGLMERAVAARHLMQTPTLPPLPQLPPSLQSTLLSALLPGVLPPLIPLN